VKAANAAFKNKPFDLGACETAAAAKYDKTTAGVKKCPACAVSGAVGLRPAIETMQNERDGLLYCAGTEPLPG
jgi:hypothetical protein